jgi:protein-L-isoaspartate(D-aspartate) O-methyltransferase
MTDEEARRARLVRRVAAEMEALQPRTGVVLSPRVAAALGSVPRHLFLPSGLAASAYDDTALPIGWGQTISQPLIVALMTELARPDPEARVLEIGTGSGYQTAVLAAVAGQVCSIEVVPALAEAAAKRLAGLGNVELRRGDGRAGWPERAPFDAIMLTAAPAELPPALPAQLKVGGRLVAPLGRHAFAQQLCVFDKDGAGGLVRRAVLDVSFVPLV